MSAPTPKAFDGLSKELDEAFSLIHGPVQDLIDSGDTDESEKRILKRFLSNKKMMIASPLMLSALREFCASVKITGGIGADGCLAGAPDWYDLGCDYKRAVESIKAADGE